MTRKGKTGNRIIIASGIIGIVFVYIGFTSGGLDPTILEGLQGLSIIDSNSQRVFCDESSCIWNWRSFNPVTTTGIVKEKIDLALFNINEPIIVNWQIDVKTIAPECEPLLADLRLQVEVNDGVNNIFPSVAGVSQSVDISRFITTNTGELEIAIGTEFCIPINPDTQNLQISNGEFPPASPTILFTKFGAEATGQIEEMMEEEQMMVECFGCRGSVIAMAQSQQMCPVVSCALFIFVDNAIECPSGTSAIPNDVFPIPEGEKAFICVEGLEPINGNGDFPMLTVSTGIATQIFVVLGIMIVAVVGIAIFIRRKSAPITEF